MSPVPPRFSRTATYLAAILLLATLVVAGTIAFALIGLDENSTPLALSVIGFITTTTGALLVLLRVEAVNLNVNGKLAELTEANRDLHERLTTQAGESDG